MASKTSLASIVILLLSAAALTSVQGDSNLALHNDLLKLAKNALENGTFDVAEARSKSALALFPDSREAGLMLGEAYLHEGKYQMAYEPLSRFFRSGRDRRHDLLMAIADSFVNVPHRSHLNSSILVDFKHERQTIDTIGEKELLPRSQDNPSIGACAFLIYAATPVLSPKESLDFAQRAEAIVPGNPIAMYLIGDAQRRMGRYADAKPYLASAMENGYGKLLQMAKDSNSKNEASLRITKG